MTRDDVVLRDGEAARWAPVSHATLDGDRATAWQSRAPDEFADQLQNDLDGLHRRAARETAACGGGLIEMARLNVAGRPALLRIERPPVDERMPMMYAATLIVVLDDGVAVEVTVICRGPGGRQARRGADDAAVIARARRMAEQLAEEICFPLT